MQINLADDRVLAESLEKRAEALVEKTKKSIDDLKKTDHAHLTAHLQHQLEMVEGIVASLKTQLADKTKVFETHQVNVIEEDLKYLENSITDELKTIDEAKNHVSQTKSLTQLITQAEELIKRAHEAATTHKHAREAASIEYEITAIETLVKALKAKPTGAELKKDEEQLARHEKTLEKLIEKAAHRTNPKNPKKGGL